jgi:hypothetical protein
MRPNLNIIYGILLFYANFNVLFVNKLFHRYKNRQKMCLILLLLGCFFDSSLSLREKPNLHLFTKNFMLPIKQNHILG